MVFQNSIVRRKMFDILLRKEWVLSEYLVLICLLYFCFVSNGIVVSSSNVLLLLGFVNWLVL